MVIYSTLFLFNIFSNFVHAVKILFNSSDFYSIISAVLLVSGPAKWHLAGGGDGSDYGGF